MKRREDRSKQQPEEIMENRGEEDEGNKGERWRRKGQGEGRRKKRKKKSKKQRGSWTKNTEAETKKSQPT